VLLVVNETERLVETIAKFSSRWPIGLRVTIIEAIPGKFRDLIFDIVDSAASRRATAATNCSSHRRITLIALGDEAIP
jgi:hypothetical protein